jgi:hypothetical protein
LTSSIHKCVLCHTGSGAPALLQLEEAADLLVGVVKTQGYAALTRAFGMLMVCTGTQCFVINRFASGYLHCPLPFVLGRVFAAMAHDLLHTWTVLPTAADLPTQLAPPAVESAALELFMLTSYAACNLQDDRLPGDNNGSAGHARRCAIALRLQSQSSQQRGNYAPKTGIDVAVFQHMKRGLGLPFL